TVEELANYKGEWVIPASTRYHDEFTIYGTRAPSQAWGIVEAMNVLEQCVPTWYPGQTLATLGPANPLYWHALIEAKKVVYADLYREDADPNVQSVQLDLLASKASAASLCGKVNPNKASSTGAPRSESTAAGDTIYLAAA